MTRRLTEQDRICDNEIGMSGYLTQDDRRQFRSVGFWNPGNLEKWTEKQQLS